MKARRVELWFGRHAGIGRERVWGMGFSITTWNINSVRLRMPIVEQLVLKHRPDILCLQETKV
ncbi:endonuclease/exonuclease/phosphatase family protein, partial [Rhizobium leguminosarum]|uniref:endonuclease/exonuclease/phosphatase family protein n=1 Tax=Rhizobium leguminosarum TaxID=384 RepID=UPI0035284F41